MIYISNLKQIDKIIREHLILESGIQEEFVRAAHSEYGTDLDKKNGSVFNSIEKSDTVMLFEISSEDSEMSNSEETSEGLVYHLTFRVQVIMYGDDTLTLSKVLAARLRTQKSRELLHDKGIHLRTVSNPTKIEDFKNDTIWMRNDIEMQIACDMLIDKISDVDKFEQYAETNIEIV